ncbi:MAG TPA: discoidin domain-containing protein, partial [Tepidisphaeraceae bacterium]|nr:discoidin domain-containing protein [Tepidisphaeraceae bacterium]
FTASLAERTVVQLPVFFYPGLLDVRDDGRGVSQSGHIDRLLALDLPPGDHDVLVKFVGVRWANYASGAAWAGVCILATVALVRRMRKRATSALAYERRFIRAPAPAAFPLRAAVLCFALLAIPMKLSAGVERWQKHNLRKAAGNITVSSAVSRDLEALHAFDNDLTTAWAAAGSNPAWVKVEYDKPRRVSRVRLEARETSLLEAWHTVRVVLYRGGGQVAEQTFSLPDASKVPLQELRLDALSEADRVELYFSDPVSVTLDGRTIDARLCNPGYKEIRVE